MLSRLRVDAKAQVAEQKKIPTSLWEKSNNPAGGPAEGGLGDARTVGKKSTPQKPVRITGAPTAGKLVL